MKTENENTSHDHESKGTPFILYVLLGSMALAIAYIIFASLFGT